MSSNIGSDEAPTKRKLLEYARLYRDQGFVPIAVDPGAKSPTRTGWPSEQGTDEELESKLIEGGNLGLLLGRGGLIDVDIDDLVVRELARHFLPKSTAISGPNRRSMKNM